MTFKLGSNSLEEVERDEIKEIASRFGGKGVRRSGKGSDRRCNSVEVGDSQAGLSWVFARFLSSILDRAVLK